MAKSLSVHWRGPGEVYNDGLTRYIAPSSSSPESDQASSTDRTLRQAGTAANLFVTIESNTVTAASTITLQDSTVDTSLVVSITASTNGDFEDTSNTATLVAADEIRFEVVTGVGGTSLTIDLVSFEFDSDANMVTLLGCNSGGSTALGASVTTYLPVMGGRNANTTESLREYRIGVGSVTWRDLALRVATNSRSDATTVGSRIEGVNGNQIVSVAANTSDVTTEDTSNTDTISADNDIDWEVITGGGTGSINIEKIWGSLISTASQWFTCIHGNDERINDGLTRFWPIRGEMSIDAVTEDDTDVRAPFAFTAKELIVHQSRNVGSVDATYDFRVNGADGNQSVNLAAVGIGTDTANTDDIVDGDDINFKSSSPVGGTDYDTQYIGFAAAAATISDYRYRMRFFG